MQTSTTPQPRKIMTRFDYAQAAAKSNPNAPAYWMTNAEVLELLEEIAQLKAEQAQPAPVLFTGLFVEART